MRPGLLLDTHAAIWIAKDEPIDDGAADALSDAVDQGWPVLVSPITAWEIGLLVAKNRIGLALSPQDFFEGLLGLDGIELAPMPPTLLIESSFLPGEPPNDPADRILAATARRWGYRLITRDRALLSYAEAGHILAIPC
jgi:PIN domain nuclease of toxin-antitoxin system